LGRVSNQYLHQSHRVEIIFKVGEPFLQMKYEAEAGDRKQRTVASPLFPWLTLAQSNISKEDLFATQLRLKFPTGQSQGPLSRSIPPPGVSSPPVTGSRCSKEIFLHHLIQIRASSVTTT
jgi:hypothetical protein